MKLNQSHGVAGVVALAVLAASYWISMTGLIRKSTLESIASVPEFDPKGMVGHGELLNQLLKLLSEVDGEPGSVQRLASARRVEKAILTIEAKIDRPWTEQGKKQAALIQYCRHALKEEIGESAGQPGNPSEMAYVFTLFACGVIGWASTKWVNHRYENFVSSRLNLKLKTNDFEDLDDFNESPARRKGNVTPKALLKGSMSPKTPKSKGRNARSPRKSTALRHVIEAEPFSTLVAPPPLEESNESTAELADKFGTLASVLAPVVESRKVIDFLVFDEQNIDEGCDMTSSHENLLSRVSATCASCEHHMGIQNWDAADARDGNQVEIEFDSDRVMKASDEGTEDSNGKIISIYPPNEEGRNDTVEKDIDNDIRGESQDNDTGCVYAPCAPGAPLQKFWPVLINGGEQFYTDGKQMFRMACIPLPAASEEGDIDPDGSTTPDAEDGMSTASDSDVFSEGFTMTRSHSEPSFPTPSWIE